MALMSTPPTSIDFKPHILCRGGHLQTLAGLYWPTPLAKYQAKQMIVACGDGDHIALHDDCPESWSDGDQVVLLLHGIAGCHGSKYMVRLADRLQGLGVRVFRMDMRGTGAVTGKARLPGHAGRTEDAAAAILRIEQICPKAPLTLVGFSMGGNIALGTLADASQKPIGNLRGGIAVCPPVDLSRCCRELRSGLGHLYDQYLVKHLKLRWQATGGSLRGSNPRSIYEFDDKVTAPLSGFRDAEDYYAHCSSGPRLSEIELPTKILAAQDDPIVAFDAIVAAPRSEHVELFVAKTGGHLGFFGSGTTSRLSDSRWMDWQLVKWITDESLTSRED